MRWPESSPACSGSSSPGSSPSRVINKAIDYESGRDGILALLNKAAGRPVAPDGPEIFSRTIQSTVGIATGIIAFSAAMGAP